MKMTKSELKEMIRECLREALNEDAFSGGVAGDATSNGGTVRGRGASVQPSKDNYLDRLKSKNADLVDIITVKGKDIKPGMITQAGQVKEAEVKKNNRGETKVYIMHTNNYDGFWDVDEDMQVMADPENSSEPFTGKWQDLLKMGLNESVVEGIFGNKYKGKDILVYRGNGKDDVIAIADSSAKNYNMINFRMAHAKKNGNKESDYTIAKATDVVVKRYKKGLKAAPDISSSLPSWANQYVKDAKAQRAKDFEAEERQKARDAEARRAAERKKWQSTSKNPDDDYVYIQGNGYGTYKYREELDDQLDADVDSIFEDLF